MLLGGAWICLMASHSPFCDYDMTHGGSHYTTESLLKMDTVGMTIDLPPSLPPSHPNVLVLVMWCCCCLSRAGNAGTKNCASATIRYGSCDIMVWWWSFQLNRHHHRRPSSSMAPFKMFISSFSFCSFFIVISFVINRKDSDRTDGPIDQGEWVDGWAVGIQS